MCSHHAGFGHGQHARNKKRRPNAWLLNVEGLDSSSQRHQLAWKAWRRDNDLQWELTRVFRSLGYIEKSRHTQLHKTVGKQMPKWAGFWTLQIGGPERYGGSRDQADHRKVGIAEVASTEEEFWMDMVALVSCFLWWEDHRRTQAGKEVVRAVATTFFAATCEPAFLVGLRTMSAETLARCDAGHHDAVGRCACAQNLVDQAKCEGSAVVQLAFLFSLAALGQRIYYSACVAHLRFILAALKAHIDDRAADWGTSSLHAMGSKQLRGSSGKKRRRTDPHYRDIVAQDVDAARARGVHERDLDVDKSNKGSTSRTWLLKHMSERLALGKMLGQWPQTVFFTFDVQPGSADLRPKCSSTSRSSRREAESSCWLRRCSESEGGGGGGGRISGMGSTGPQRTPKVG